MTTRRLRRSLIGGVPLILYDHGAI